MFQVGSRARAFATNHGAAELARCTTTTKLPPALPSKVGAGTTVAGRSRPTNPEVPAVGNGPHMAAAVSSVLPLGVAQAAPVLQTLMAVVPSVATTRPSTRCAAAPPYQQALRVHEPHHHQKSQLGQMGKILRDPKMTTSLLDRLAHHCHIVEPLKDSYRFKNSNKQPNGERKAVKYWAP